MPIKGIFFSAKHHFTPGWQKRMECRERELAKQLLLNVTGQDGHPDTVLYHNLPMEDLNGHRFSFEIQD